MGKPDKQTKKMGDPKCGSKGCWGALMGLGYVAGIACLVAIVVVGSCDCNDKCMYDTGGETCWSFFGGCEKGDYDLDECQAAQVACEGTVCCDNSACKYGGMSVGMGWFLFIVGIGLVAVLPPLACCGFMACCCCAAGGKGSPPVPEALEK